jgi:hypothetical protein
MGADVNIVDGENRSCIALALQMDRHDIIALVEGNLSTHVSITQNEKSQRKSTDNPQGVTESVYHHTSSERWVAVIDDTMCQDKFGRVILFPKK